MANSTSRRLAISILLLYCVPLLQLAHARLLLPEGENAALNDSKSFSIRGGSGEGGGRGFGVSIGHGGHDTSIGIGGGLGGGAGTTRGGAVGGGSGGGGGQG